MRASWDDGVLLLLALWVSHVLRSYFHISSRSMLLLSRFINIETVFCYSRRYDTSFSCIKDRITTYLLVQCCFWVDLSTFRSLHVLSKKIIYSRTEKLAFTDFWCFHEWNFVSLRPFSFIRVSFLWAFLCFRVFIYSLFFILGITFSISLPVEAWYSITR